MPPRFLVAPDSFKGTFDASAVAEAIAAGVEEGGAVADRCPVAGKPLHLVVGAEATAVDGPAAISSFHPG